jgi:hypothetical protein
MMAMDYSAAWKVLEEIVVDFRKKGTVIPAKIMSDLKSAKTLINVLEADSSYADTSQKIEEYLLSVESYLISEGERMFGTEYIQERLKRLDDASRTVLKEKERRTKFVTGVPREHEWVRVKPSSELPIEKLKALAKVSKLSCDIQSNGRLVVHGRAEYVREFIEKMAKEYGLKSEELS